MYREELVKKVAKDTRIARREVRDVIVSTTRALAQAMKEGKEVTLIGFGTFYGRHHKGGRIAKSARTGKPVEYPAMLRPAFRATEALRQQLRGIGAPRRKRSRKK